MTAPAEDPRGGECPVKRTVYGNPCDGPGTYYCDSDLWGSACRRYFEATPPAAGRGDDSSGEAIEPGLSPEANGRRLKWFTDAELAAELNRRRALDGA